MEREDAEFRAANERIETMAEELRKAELVRDRLEGLVSQERGFRDRNGWCAGRWVGREFFHNAGHIEICPHGRPIVKRLTLVDLLREFGRI